MGERDREGEPRVAFPCEHHHSGDHGCTQAVSLSIVPTPKEIDIGRDTRDGAQNQG